MKIHQGAPAKEHKLDSNSVWVVCDPKGKPLRVFLSKRVASMFKGRDEEGNEVKEYVAAHPK